MFDLALMRGHGLDSALQRFGRAFRAAHIKI
jgi:hypothetical protein